MSTRTIAVAAATEAAEFARDIGRKRAHENGLSPDDVDAAGQAAYDAAYPPAHAAAVAVAGGLPYEATSPVLTEAYFAAGKAGALTWREAG